MMDSQRGTDTTGRESSVKPRGGYDGLLTVHWHYEFRNRFHNVKGYVLDYEDVRKPGHTDLMRLADADLPTL